MHNRLAELESALEYAIQQGASPTVVQGENHGMPWSPKAIIRNLCDRRYAKGYNASKRDFRALRWENEKLREKLISELGAKAMRQYDELMRRFADA